MEIASPFSDFRNPIPEYIEKQTELASQLFTLAQKVRLRGDTFFESLKETYSLLPAGHPSESESPISLPQLKIELLGIKKEILLLSQNIQKLPKASPKGMIESTASWFSSWFSSNLTEKELVEKRNQQLESLYKEVEKAYTELPPTSFRGWVSSWF